MLRALPATLVVDRGRRPWPSTDRPSEPAPEPAVAPPMNARPTPPPTPYRIETARLVLRPWDLRDAAGLHRAVTRSRDHLLPWLPWALFPPADAREALATVRRFRGQFDLDADHVFGIFADDDATVIGGSGLHPRIGPGAREIGYWVDAEHARRGYAREATAALVKVGFEVLRQRKIEIRVQPENTASLAIPEQLGFTDTGLLRSVCPGMDPTAFHDARVFSLMADEYATSPSAAAQVRAYDGLGEPIALTPPSAE